MNLAVTNKSTVSRVMSQSNNGALPLRYPFSIGGKESDVKIVSDPRSHKGMFEHSKDFLIPIGTPLLANKSGKVIHVDDSHPDHHPSRSVIKFLDKGQIDTAVPANEILVLDDDGNIHQYLHVKHGSSRFKNGDKFKAGDVIAESGHNGNSTAPHLHYTLFREGIKGKDPYPLVSLPVTFS